MKDRATAFLVSARSRTLTVMTAAILLGSTMAAAPVLAGAAGAASTAGLVAAPATVCADAPTLVTLTATFPGPARTIGVIAPAGATIAADSPATPIATSTGGAATLQGNGDILVSGFSLAAGTPVTVSFYATETSAASWLVQGDGDTGEGVPDSDNAGDNGDDYVGTTSTTLDSGCHLVFTAQPASTALNGGAAPISQLLGGSHASPVTVQVVDSAGHPQPVSTGVSLALSADAALSGNVAQTSATGSASFGSLANDLAGTNLTLTASAPDLASSSPSGQFNIYTSGTVCNGDCSTSPKPGFTLSATNGTGGFLAASIPPFMLSCSRLGYGFYPGIPGTTTLGVAYVNGTTTKTVTLFVARSLLTTFRAKLLALHYLVCFSSPTTFRTLYGFNALLDPTTTSLVGDGQNWYTGLLPDCEDVGSVAPCVVSRTWSTAPRDGLYVTVLAPAGDPWLR